LDGLGITASPLNDEDEGEEDDEWDTENDETLDGDGDVEMQ